LGMPGRRKRLLRQAMSGLLPETALQRTGKTALVPLLERGCLDRERATIAALFSDPQIVQRGYVRPDWLANEQAAGHEWSTNGYLLWLCISLEMWLQRYW